MNTRQGTLRKAFLARLTANLRKQACPGECMPGRASPTLSCASGCQHAVYAFESPTSRTNPCRELSAERTTGVSSREGKPQERLSCFNVQPEGPDLRSDCAAVHPPAFLGVVGCDLSAQATQSSGMNFRQGTLRSDFPARPAANLQPKQKTTGVHSRQGPTLRSEFLMLIFNPKSTTSGVNARQYAFQGFLMWLAAAPQHKQSNFKNEFPAGHPQE